VATEPEGVVQGRDVARRKLAVLTVDDVEGEVHRLEALGASRLTAAAQQEFGQTWFVLADPEGNEFCVARDRSGKVPASR